MDFPITDLMDEQACYDRLVGWLHPDGMTCPRCHQHDRMVVHRRGRDPVLDCRYRQDGYHFSGQWEPAHRLRRETFLKTEGAYPSGSPLAGCVGRIVPSGHCDGRIV